MMMGLVDVAKEVGITVISIIVIFKIYRDTQKMLTDTVKENTEAIKRNTELTKKILWNIRQDGGNNVKPN